jgi:hypothetical protein
MDAKRKDLRQKRFENYHDLIRRLVEGEHPDRRVMLDRQVAVVYELRNYKEYGDVTLRILHGLRETWASNPLLLPRLKTELELTIKFLEHTVMRHRVAADRKRGQPTRRWSGPAPRWWLPGVSRRAGRSTASR